MRVTIVGLRERIGWLRAELAKAEKDLEKRIGNGPAVQAEIPGLPPPVETPRQPSEWEVWAETFRTQRDRKLSTMGPVPPDVNTIPFINTIVPKIRADCKSDEEMMLLFDAFFADDYAAGGGRDGKQPPFALKILAGPGVRARLLAYVRGEPAPGWLEQRRTA